LKGEEKAKESKGQGMVRSKKEEEKRGKIVGGATWKKIRGNKEGGNPISTTMREGDKVFGGKI